MGKINISISKINGQDAKRFKNEQNTNVETFFYDESFEDYQNTPKTIISENGVMKMEIEVDVEYELPGGVNAGRIDDKELCENLKNWFEKIESPSKAYDALREFAIANNTIIQTAVQLKNDEEEQL